uniref:Uncharacterized protein n=2 Tax=Lynx TaxID=13124 RepID=A0A667FWL3_LYNCA
THAGSFLYSASPRWPLKGITTTLTAGISHSVVSKPAGRLQTVSKGVESLICTSWIHYSFSRSRIPDKMFQPSSRLHKLHAATRIKSTRRRPEWGTDTMKVPSLEKAHTPQVHKNIPPVNVKLKADEHLITVKPLKPPPELPAEEASCHVCLKSTRYSAVWWHGNPVLQEAVWS